MCKRMLAVLCSLLLAGSIAGCRAVPAAQKHTQTYLDVFDTVTSITAYGMTAEQFTADVEKLHTLLTEYHQLYDIYTAYPGLTNLKTVNDAAGGAPVAVDSRIVDLLRFGVDAYDKTAGQVNIMFGAVLSLWHDSRTAGLADPENAALPDAAALKDAAEHTAISSLAIDDAAGTVCVTDKEASLDVGAIAKGYAVEQIVYYAEETLGWRSALFNVGGNVRAIGGKDDDTPFTVGIQNPDLTAATAYLTTVAVADESVVTSGDYQRFYTVDGKTYAHIIDPKTLYPATHVRAVSVICADSGVADMLSTALFTLPYADGRALLEKTPGAKALWVLADGSVQQSDGFTNNK